MTDMVMLVLAYVTLLAWPWVAPAAARSHRSTPAATKQDWAPAVLPEATYDPVKTSRSVLVGIICRRNDLATREAIRATVIGPTKNAFVVTEPVFTVDSKCLSDAACTASAAASEGNTKAEDMPVRVSVTYRFFVCSEGAEGDTAHLDDEIRLYNDVVVTDCMGLAGMHGHMGELVGMLRSLHVDFPGHDLYIKQDSDTYVWWPWLAQVVASVPAKSLYFGRGMPDFWFAKGDRGHQQKEESLWSPRVYDRLYRNADNETAGLPDVLESFFAADATRHVWENPDRNFTENNEDTFVAALASWYGERLQYRSCDPSACYSWGWLHSGPLKQPKKYMECYFDLKGQLDNSSKYSSKSRFHWDWFFCHFLR
mmetsp:Transcript_57611/g.182474  ORF Transcript_57611/g.182474 Transcript_57611/m.182474 type:complete len:368 (+) Transcript_57611:42-1145(+)